MNIQDEITKLKKIRAKPYEKEIDKVLAKKSTGERAKAAIDLWLKLNPTVNDPRHMPSKNTPKLTAQEAHKLLLEDIKAIQRDMKNEYASNDSGSMRLALRMLPEMWEFIQLFHPDLFDGSSNDQRQRGYKLMRVFPQYRVAQKV